MKGYSYPMSDDGSMSLLTPPPWHFAGAVLMVDYVARPDDVRRLLPEGLEPDPEGRCAAVFAQWEWCSQDRRELRTPLRSQFSEFLVMIGARMGDREVARVPFAWVDDVVSMTRGWVQGMPKQLGRIAMTRDFSVGQVGPRPGAAGTYHGQAVLDDGALATATVEIAPEGVGVAGPPWLHTLPLVHTRHLPTWAGDEPDDCLVSSVVADVEFSAVSVGRAELSLPEEAMPAMRLVQPVELGAGYRFDYAETLVAGHRCEIGRPVQA